MRTGKPALAVHGGIGELTAQGLEDTRRGCAAAASAGWEVLAAGGSAVDGVEAAVRVLEDDPAFNAGYGSVLQQDGRVRTDAALMHGPDRTAGAVASVTGVRNTLTLARRVLEDGRHVLLVGPGAETFAESVGIRRQPPEDLVAPAQGTRWQRHHGTVGCVALDTEGRLVAGTSTGGTFDALPGRVGDSPLVAAGTWADTRVAVSCTGHGESIMRAALAVGVAWRRRGSELSAAAAEALAELDATVGGKAGLIAVDGGGALIHLHNDVHMPVALVDESGLRVEV